MTTIDFTQSPIQTADASKWTSLKKSNYSVRYFNGRKYYIIDSHDYMSSIVFPPREETRIYWTIVSHFVSWPGKHSTYRQQSVKRNGYNDAECALIDLIPDDMQAIPF